MKIWQKYKHVHIHISLNKKTLHVLIPHFSFSHTKIEFFFLFYQQKRMNMGSVWYKCSLGMLYTEKERYA